MWGRIEYTGLEDKHHGKISKKMYFTPVFSSVYLFCIVARLPLSFYFGLIFLIFLAFYTGFLMQKKGQLFLLIPGNIATTVTSYLACLYYTDWHFFYQPFSPTKLILLLAVIYLIPQVMGIFWARIFTQKKQNINIFK